MRMRSIIWDNGPEIRCICKYYNTHAHFPPYTHAHQPTSVLLFVGVTTEEVVSLMDASRPNCHKICSLLGAALEHSLCTCT